MRTLIALVALLLVNTAVFANDTEQPGRNMDSSKVPLEAFFKRDQFSNMVISPDGEHLAVTYSTGTSSTVAIMDIGLTEVLSSFNFGEYRIIGRVYWPRNDRIILSYSKFVGFLDTRGEPAVHVAYNIDGTKGRQLTAPTGASYQILNLLRDKPNKILVSKRILVDFADRQGDFDQVPAKIFEIDIEKGKENYLATEPSEIGRAHV